MTVLSSSCAIIMDRATNAPGHTNNVIDGLNTTEKYYLKGEIEHIGKLAGNVTSTVGMLPSASKDVSIKTLYQFIHILNIKAGIQ